MIAQRVGLVALAIAAAGAWMGCQPAVQPPGGTQKARPVRQKEASPQFMQLDDDAIRARLLAAEAVQKDLGLTADQIEKIRDSVKSACEAGSGIPCQGARHSSPSPDLSAGGDRGEGERFSGVVRGRQEQVQGDADDGPGDADAQPKRATKANSAPDGNSGCPGPAGDHQGVGYFRRATRQNPRPRDRMEKKQLAAWPKLRGLNQKERRQKVIEFMKESSKIAAEARKPMLDILTPEQRAKLEKLQGKKIEVTWPDDELMPEDAEY